MEDAQNHYFFLNIDRSHEGSSYCGDAKENCSECVKKVRPVELIQLLPSDKHKTMPGYDGIYKFITLSVL